MFQEVADVAGSADFVDAMNKFHRAHIRFGDVISSVFVVGTHERRRVKGATFGVDLPKP